MPMMRAQRMQPGLASSEQGQRTQIDALMQRALLLDLEVSHQGNILKLGAACDDVSFTRFGGQSLAATLDQLAKLAANATLVLGHNLVRHDLRVLREAAPGHPALKLPIIDTLILSPICFPENPYHRLVKDYKLVRESINDPVADARPAATLFADEFQALDGLQQKDPRLFEVLHFLLSTPDPEVDQLSRGMAMLFAALGGTLPPKDRVLAVCRKLIPGWGCASVPVDESLVQTQSQRLALAYVLTWLRVAGSNSVLPPWVRLEHPLTGELIKRLREVPCNSVDCAYCRRVHNSQEQLRTFFGFEAFRPTPQNSTGGSLQQDIVEAGMRNDSPVGAGRTA